MKEEIMNDMKEYIKEQINEINESINELKYIKL